MAAELTIQIHDDLWPKLRLVGQIRFVDGNRANFDETIMYDNAYNKFEGVLHNMLRPLCENVINRRKNPAQFRSDETVPK
jgi:hypothetical protein